jgi:hypothetical protein
MFISLQFLWVSNLDIASPGASGSGFHKVSGRLVLGGPGGVFFQVHSRVVGRPPVLADGTCMGDGEYEEMVVTGDLL